MTMRNRKIVGTTPSMFIHGIVPRVYADVRVIGSVARKIGEGTKKGGKKKNKEDLFHPSFVSHRVSEQSDERYN